MIFIGFIITILIVFWGLGQYHKGVKKALKRQLSHNNIEVCIELENELRRIMDLENKTIKSFNTKEIYPELRTISILNGFWEDITKSSPILYSIKYIFSKGSYSRKLEYISWDENNQLVEKSLINFGVFEEYFEDYIPLTYGEKYNRYWLNINVDEFGLIELGCSRLLGFENLEEVKKNSFYLGNHELIAFDKKDIIEINKYRIKKSVIRGENLEYVDEDYDIYTRLNSFGYEMNKGEYSKYKNKYISLTHK